MSDTDKAPVLKKGEKLVNIACRATPNCAGKSAIMKVIKQNNMGQLAGGGRMSSYTCQKCGRPFMIST